MLHIPQYIRKVTQHKEKNYRGVLHEGKKFTLKAIRNIDPFTPLFFSQFASWTWEKSTNKASLATQCREVTRIFNGRGFHIARSVDSTVIFTITSRTTATTSSTSTTRCIIPLTLSRLQKLINADCLKPEKKGKKD